MLYARSMLMRLLATGTVLAAALLLSTGVAGATGVAQTAACNITQKSSLKGAAKTNITFVNKTRTVVQLYWLDYKGHLVYYSTIGPGARLVQRTFKTHPWLVLDGKFGCVGYVVAPKAAYTVGP